MSNSYYEIVPIVNRWIQKRAKFELQTEEKRLLSSWLGRDSTLFFEQLDSSTLKSRLSTPREGSFFHQPRIKLNILSREDFSLPIPLWYSYFESRFGQALGACSEEGLSFLAFGSNREILLTELQKTYPTGEFIEKKSKLLQKVESLLNGQERLKELNLHLHASFFQAEVWSKLLELKPGSCSCYGNLARAVKNPGAHRAVGTAVGSNPIAYCIPCHRIIKSDGEIGNYRWGVARKVAMLGSELL